MRNAISIITIYYNTIAILCVKNVLNKIKFYKIKFYLTLFFCGKFSEVKLAV